MTTDRRYDLHAIARRIMLEYGFRVDFPSEAMTQATAAVDPKFDKSPMKDLTGLLWSSVDNDDSRDLDQIEVVTAESAGIRLLVAIANVDHFVPSHSAIDGTAQQNTTSIYTGVETFPLLPSKLSTDLSSLLEQKKRLAVVIDILIDAEGKTIQSDIYPAVVLNKAQLTYDAVAYWLEEKSGNPPLGITAQMLEKIRSNQELQEQLRLQDRLAQLLERKRHEAGALSFGTVELRPQISGDGEIHLNAHVANRATKLIENFMIAANQATTSYLVGKGFPSVRRVVRTPKNWDRIVELARTLGFDLPGEPEVKALQEFLTDQQKRSPDHFADLSLSVIKLLGRGEYVVELPDQKPLGHFGLAVENYSHSTAPNRRYPDILTQRLLLAATAGGNVPFAIQDLQSLAARCTEKEDDANKVERSVKKSAAAVAMANRIGEKFPAVVTGSSAKGVWVRIASPPIEGKLEKINRRLDVGDRLTVRLTRTNPDRGYIDFEPT